MSSDIEALRADREVGWHGKKAKFKEYERQLRAIPKWLESQKRVAKNTTAELKARIKRLRKRPG